MKFVAIGITHKEAPVEIREQFFMSEQERRRFLRFLRMDPRIAEAIVVSTCNRTEIYAHVEGTGILARESILDKLFRAKHLDADPAWESCFFELSGEDGMRHFMEVATGLDSLVLGEKQILGQIKAAIELARAEGMLRTEFNVLSQIVVRAGKKAQDETAIGAGGASVSWAAVQLAEQKLGCLKDKSILIVGAGKMSELTAEQLHNKGVNGVHVINRTRRKAEALAEKINGRAYSYLDLYKILGRVDLCIVSASAPRYILDQNLMGLVMRQRRQRPLINIDISTPRNIDPDVAGIPGVGLYTIDDLSDIVNENLNKRRQAVAAVETIIDKKIEEFHRKIHNNRKFQQREWPSFPFNYAG